MAISAIPEWRSAGRKKVEDEKGGIKE